MSHSFFFSFQDSTEVEDCMTPSEVRPTQAEDIKKNSSVYKFECLIDLLISDSRVGGTAA